MELERVGAVAFPRSLTLAWWVFVSMRPSQWTKNALVFLPLIFSIGERWTLESMVDFGYLAVNSIFAFLTLCALSSGVYIINDIFDRKNDRLHPVKRYRPIASGAVPVPVARLVAAGLLAAAFSGGLMMGFGFFMVVLLYLAINLAYCSYLKHIAILDVMALSSGFILRIVAGSLAIDVETSPWLYTTIGLGALFLSLGKRQSELRAAGGNAASQRAVLSQYTPQLLNQLINITAACTLLAYGLYTFSAANVPENKSMMLTLPFVVFGLFRYMYILNHTNNGEAPNDVMVKDMPLVIGIFLWGVVSVLVLAFNR